MEQQGLTLFVFVEGSGEPSSVWWIWWDICLRQTSFAAFTWVRLDSRYAALVSLSAHFCHRHIILQWSPNKRCLFPLRSPGCWGLLDRALWWVLQWPAHISIAQQRRVCPQPTSTVSASHVIALATDYACHVFLWVMMAKLNYSSLAHLIDFRRTIQACRC